MFLKAGALSLALLLASRLLGLLRESAGLPPGQVAATERRVALALVAGGSVLALLLLFGRKVALAWLAGGLPAAMLPAAAHAMVWSALALPAALLAGLWATRLQHE